MYVHELLYKVKNGFKYTFIIIGGERESERACFGLLTPNNISEPLNLGWSSMTEKRGGGRGESLFISVTMSEGWREREREGGRER